MRSSSIPEMPISTFLKAVLIGTVIQRGRPRYRLHHPIEMKTLPHLKEWIRVSGGLHNTIRMSGRSLVSKKKKKSSLCQIFTNRSKNKAASTLISQRSCEASSQSDDSDIPHILLQMPGPNSNTLYPI